MSWLIELYSFVLYRYGCGISFLKVNLQLLRCDIFVDNMRETRNLAEELWQKQMKIFFQNILFYCVFFLKKQQ